MSERNRAALAKPSRHKRERSAQVPEGQAANPSCSKLGIKLQLDLPVGSRIGPGKIQLLELVETEGSLSRAARAMGLSYRRAWIFVQHINAALDKPAVATPKHGHGGSAARLTELGRELIRRYRHLESMVEAHGEEDLHWLERHQRQE
jgi:molybdate transport system regulatory protein